MHTGAARDANRADDTACGTGKNRSHRLRRRAPRGDGTAVRLHDDETGAAPRGRETGEVPAVLRAQVTSPGGTTAAALAVLEAMAVRAAFGEALKAARDRSVELGS